MDTGALDFHSPYFSNYLDAVEDTESPRLFHLWAAVSSIAAALGRRVWFPMGMIGSVFPNHYILLVGPPAVRKSSSLGIAYRLVKDCTNVRMAPTDTGGQRQGLIRAMSRGDAQHEVAEALEAAMADPFSSIENGLDKEAFGPVPDKADRHTLAAYWSELSGAIGQANHTMMDFLVQTYDGDDYRYEIKGGETVLDNTLMNILACTTPVSMSTAMPPAAEGHGFLSRFILVHGDENYKNVVWPQLPSSELIGALKETLAFVNLNLHGEATITKDAKAYAESLYGQQLEIADPRFQHYKSRRFVHLLKLALVLTASRKELVIARDDLELAHTILRITEKGMPDALGQFGLSPLAKLKQGILEYLRSLNGPATLPTIQAAFHRDARPQDVIDALGDLKTGDVIVQTQTTQGTILIAAKRVKKNTRDNELVDFLTAKQRS